MALRRRRSIGVTSLMRLTILFLFSLLAFGQSDNENIVTIIPTTNSSGTPTAAGQLRFRDLETPGSAHYVGLQGPASVAADAVWTMPGAFGTGCWQDNGSGVLTIGGCLTTAGGQTITGTDTWQAIQVFDANIEFDFSGALKASIGWDNTNGALAVTVPVLGALMEWDAAGQVTTFYSIVPASTNTISIGSASAYIADGYFTDLVTQSGTALSVTGAGGLVVSAGIVSSTSLGAPAIADTGITGSTQCVEANTAGVFSGTGAPCSSPCPTCVTTAGGVTIAGTVAFSGLLDVTGTTANLIPNANVAYDLGQSGGNAWGGLFTDTLYPPSSGATNSGAVTTFGSFVPGTSGTYNIGTPTLLFNTVFADEADVTSIQMGSSTGCVQASSGFFSVLGSDCVILSGGQTITGTDTFSGTLDVSGTFKLGTASGCVSGSSGTITVLSGQACGTAPGSWSSWTPTVTNLTGVTAQGFFSTNGTWTAFSFQITGTTTSGGATPTFSLPTSVTTSIAFIPACQIVDGLTSFAANGSFGSGAVVSVNSGTVALPGSTTLEFVCSGTYEN